MSRGLFNGFEGLRARMTNKREYRARADRTRFKSRVPVYVSHPAFRQSSHCGRGPPVELLVPRIYKHITQTHITRDVLSSVNVTSTRISFVNEESCVPSG